MPDFDRESLIFIYVPILIGIVIMVTNIIRYILFIINSRDVLIKGSRKITFWKIVSLILLIFFLIGYAYVGFFSNPDTMMAMILFGGSVFVAIVLTLMFNLMNTVKARSIEIAETLIGIIDTRDSNLNGHSQHVKDIMMIFYRYLPANLRNTINPVTLGYASLFHDLGKLGVSESILNKPGKLTEEEWAIMRQHPKMGVDLLKKIAYFGDILDWILYHHERADGEGYYKMSPEEVPLVAKMISIADTYSAITMRRSYKDPKSHEEAMAIIKDVAGTQLDKELVDIFVKINKEELLAVYPYERK